VKKNKRPDIVKTLVISIFIVSLSLFAYQVTLTRLYSAILSYHYVFLATSIAILGIGIGSIWAYKDRTCHGNAIGAGPAQVEKTITLTNKLTFILSCGFVAVFVLIYIQPFADSLVAFAALGIVPFIISGYLYSTLFKAWSDVSGKLYFADLIGGGAGSVAIVFLLNNAGMLRTAVLICLLPLAVLFILPVKAGRLRIVGCTIAVLLAVCLFLPMRYVNEIEKSFFGLFSNTGKEYGVMEKAGLAPEIVFSRWDSFSRTDLMKMASIPDTKFLIIDGGATAPMFEFDGNINSLEKFKTDNGYVPFAVGENDNTLLIGVGGGLDVLYALAAGSGNITAVDINSASIEAVRLFGDFNGHIFDLPQVRAHAQDGRSFVRNSNELFDLIFFSIVVTNTTQGVGFALSENYLYTVEAMEEYLARLSGNGRIAFVAHDKNTIDKLTATAIQALVNRGVPLKDTPDHLASFYRLTGTGDNAKVFDPLIIIKGDPFSREESAVLEKEISSRGALPAHLPHLYEQEPLSHVKSVRIVSLTEFVGSFDVNIRPATDDNPYFFNFDRNINAGLVQILVISLAGSILLFAIFAGGKKNRKPRRPERYGSDSTLIKQRGNEPAHGFDSLMLKPAGYFGLLGMGFMMIEIPLIQRFILHLGHPTLAFSYILAAMLIGCGIGGFFSGNKLFRRIYARIYLPPVLAAIINIVILLTLSFIFLQTAGANTVFKVMTASLVALSAGFFMGMPFPRGLAILGESGRNNLIPLMWGINGTMSVVGSAMSIVLSMAFGFSAAITAGAAVYLAVGLFRKV